MKKIILGIATTIAMSISLASFAEPGPYIQAQVGLGDIHTGTNNLVNDGSNQKEQMGGFASRLSMGYLFNYKSINYGAELGWDYSPQSRYEADGFNLYYEGYSFDLLGTLKYNIGTHWNIFGKTGVALVHQETSMNQAYAMQIGADKTRYSTDKFEPKFATGLGYDFSKHIAATLTYSHTFGDTPEINIDNNQDLTVGDVTKVASRNALLFGLQYKF